MMGRQKGFTLIEICIVITIIGLMVAGFARAFQIFVIQKQQSDLEQTYDIVKSALTGC